MNLFASCRTLLPSAFLLIVGCAPAPPIDLDPFDDSRHHWYDVRDEKRLIDPLTDQLRLSDDDIRGIAENILLYQNPNGGWPKNYDMQAVLTAEQRAAVMAGADDATSTIDNGATHSHVAYLAQAFLQTGEPRFRSGAERGIDYLLAAQGHRGGWPQYFPDSSGYRQYITYNDGAMIGVMRVLRDIVQEKEAYGFLDARRRARAASAFRRGTECILQTQIVQDGTPTGWGQQHDDVTLAPRWARTFEPAAVTSMESGEVVEFLMSLSNPSERIIRSVESAIAWLRRSELKGIRFEAVKAPKTEYQYHTTESDRVVVQDPDAPVIWSRFYEIGTNTPLFCNRDGKVVYTLAEVERERRTGYAWYTYEPAQTLERYEKWKERLDRRRPARQPKAHDLSRSDNYLMASEGGMSVSGSKKDSLVHSIEQDRLKAEEWLRSSPSSYLATIHRVDFGERTTLTVGRSPECDVVIDDPAISARHVAVTVVADSFLVESIDPGAHFGAGGTKQRAVLPASSISIDRFAIRLSHQRFPALIVFDTKSPGYSAFKGMLHFPIDLSYRFVLSLTPDPTPDTVIIQSTRGNLRRALRMGWFEFSVRDTLCRLEVSRLLEPGVGEDSYSVFFRDRTCGTESYGMGRYVDAESLSDGRFVLDFNQAYNPACAYSPHYNCPIPPEGNSLPVEIRAGEMDGAYGKH